jgi:hypothetical protein
MGSSQASQVIKSYGSSLSAYGKLFDYWVLILSGLLVSCFYSEIQYVVIGNNFLMESKRYELRVLRASFMDMGQNAIRVSS